VTCEELVEALEAYVAGTLAPDGRSGFEEHARNCPACRHYLESYRATIELCRRGAEAESKADGGSVSEALVRRIVEARRRGGG
jgi:anti-sigma factor RsiW